MLALKSYEQNNGFSEMSADELYFINGGSATTGQKIAYVIAKIMVSSGGIGSNPDLEDAWARAVSGYKD